MTSRSLRRHIVPVGRRFLPYLPERLSRFVLATFLRHVPELWGWSASSERLRHASCAYRDAFPEANSAAFIDAFVAARAHGLATSMTWMSRKDTDHASVLVDAHLLLRVPDNTPCVVTYVHYSIDPILQLAVIASNPGRDFRWAVLPPQPNPPVDWEDERALYLAGVDIDSPIARVILPVTSSGWLIDALKHIRAGGSVLMALDTALDSTRASAVKLTIGSASMAVSPAIAFLAMSQGVRLFFAWPERAAGKTWILQYQEFASTEALALAASEWIHAHHLDWAGWHYLLARRRAIDIRRMNTG